MLKRYSMLVVVALLIIPLAASADPPKVQIEGAGTMRLSGEQWRFTVNAMGDDPDPSGQIPATGRALVERLDDSGVPMAQIQGSVTCVRDLSEFAGDGIWEIRFETTRAQTVRQVPDDWFPADLPGNHASLYVKDDPTGDSAGFLDSNVDPDSPDCGPRGFDFSPLTTGQTKVTIRS